jgi:ribonuclease P protein component
MTSRIYRLPGEEFRAKGYRTISTPFFLLKVKKNSLTRFRVGVVVGKSVNKSAAKRNFWKRQVKEGFSANPLPGHDMLMMLSPNAGGLTKKQFQEALAKAIVKI